MDNQFICNFHPSGFIKEEYLEINGHKEGEYIQYYNNEHKQKRCVINYINGLKNGMSIHYYRRGNLFQTSEYLNDKKHGKTIEYFNDGSIYQITIYQNGILISEEKV